MYGKGTETDQVGQPRGFIAVENVNVEALRQVSRATTVLAIGVVVTFEPCI